MEKENLDTLAKEIADDLSMFSFNFFRMMATEDVEDPLIAKALAYLDGGITARKGILAKLGYNEEGRAAFTAGLELSAMLQKSGKSLQDLRK